MAGVLAASALLLGAAAERLRRTGIPTELFLAATLTLSMAAQLALLLGLPVSSYVLFSVIATAAEAHQAALGLNLVLQAAAFVWFIRPHRKPAVRHLAAHSIHALATSLGLVPAAALSYARARHAWSLHMARARAQEKAWRSAAFASFAVLALLLSSLGSAILGTSVAAPVIEGAQFTETRDFAGADSERSKPSFMLDRPAEVVVPASLALSPLVGPRARSEPW